MKKFLKFIFVTAFVLGGWALATASLHVVRAPGTMAWGYIPQNIQLVPKNNLTFHETWVDTTKWTADDVARHPAFVDRLQQANKLDLVKQAMATPAPIDTAPQASIVQTPTHADLPAATVETTKPAPTPAPAPATPEKPKPKSIFDFSDVKK